ncbi:MAG TPA: lysylphosphatidylglycerol synthase transmembrane domain-containing protein [Candidatus Methylacidiphilales bacterium]|nr:lysylphosphatidylglycerol synthase transmembrane domain-containing protein [Candidatus Methylacidiphilales bacterium]
MEFLRRRLGLIFRALVSIFLIGLLFYKQKIDWYQVWINIRAMDAAWLVVAFFCFTPVMFIVAWRWRMLLGVHGVHLRFWRIFELTMIGQFFSAFLFGTTGGDVVKIYYVARAVPQRKAAVAFTVVVDRIIGLIALLLFGVGLSCTQLNLLLSTGDTRFFTGLFYFFAFGGVVASIVSCLGPSLLRHQGLRNFVKKLPFMHRGISLFEAYEKTARAFGINCVALVGSLPSHVCNVLMGYSIMRAMHLESSLLPFFSILAMVNMLIALPISISGLGVREQLFIMFLGLLGIDKNHALTFSLTYFLVGVTWNLLSGPFYFLYRHETHTPPPDVEAVEPIFSER